MSNLAKNPPTPVRSPTRGLQLIAGRFTTAGVAAPVKVVPGVGWTVARTGVGVHVVTLDQAYKKVLHVDPQIIGAAGNTKSARITATTDGGVHAGASFTIELQNVDGTAAEQTGLDVTFVCYAAQVK